jgi:ACS family sodium-dependent inorganic phosphate cotransporter
MESTVEDAPLFKRKRYLVCLLAFFGLFNIYALRINLSLAIIPMAEHFGWDSKQNGVVLSSFYYGYLVTQVIGGVWARKYGGNLLFGAGVFATAILTILTPLAASWSIYAMIAVRVVIGLFEVF